MPCSHGLGSSQSRRRHVCLKGTSSHVYTADQRCLPLSGSDITFLDSVLASAQVQFSSHLQFDGSHVSFPPHQLCLTPRCWNRCEKSRFWRATTCNCRCLGENKEHEANSAHPQDKATGRCQGSGSEGRRLAVPWALARRCVPRTGGLDSAGTPGLTYKCFSVEAPIGWSQWGWLGLFLEFVLARHPRQGDIPSGPAPKWDSVTYRHAIVWGRGWEEKGD